MYVQIVCMYGRKETIKPPLCLCKKYVYFLIKRYINIKYLINL